VVGGGEAEVRKPPRWLGIGGGREGVQHTEESKRSSLGVLLAVFPPRTGTDEMSIDAAIKAHVFAARDIDDRVFQQACIDLLETWPYTWLPSPGEIRRASGNVVARLRVAERRIRRERERIEAEQGAMPVDEARQLLAELEALPDADSAVVNAARDISRFALRRRIGDSKRNEDDNER
jgi:hypothetical protein